MDGYTIRRSRLAPHNGARLAQCSSSSDFQLAAFTLDARNTIEEFDSAAERLFGYSRREAIGRHVSMLFPKLAQICPMHDERINPRLAFLAQCGVAFRSTPRDGESFVCLLFFHELQGADPVLRVLARRVETTGLEYV